MSWEYHKDSIEGVRKVVWDGLWHIVYRIPISKNKSRETWDRVNRETAMRAEKNMAKWRWK